MNDKEQNFTWVQTHKEIAEYLKGKKNEQHELIDFLKKIGITGLNDEVKPGEKIELKEIDPFTFYSYIHKYGDERRLEFLQRTSNELGLHVPSDVTGIPTAPARSVRLFTRKYQRDKNDVNRLWTLFHNLIENSMTNEILQEALSVEKTGITRLTEGFFCVNPEKYLPINGPVKPYLKEVHEINPKFSTWQEYLEILNQVKEKTDMPFYKVSYEAWVWNEEQKKTNYWVFQGSPKIFDLKQALHDNVLNSFKVSSHKDKIAPGDKVIIWLSGDNKGCYALAEVDSELFEDGVNEVTARYYKSEDKIDPYEKVKLRITHNLVNNPIFADQIKNETKLANLKVGIAGTNFSATQEEYETLVKLAEGAGDDKWKELANVVHKINDEKAIRKFFATVKHVINEFNLSADDEITYASAINRYVQFTIGSRYVTHLERKKGKVIQGFYVDNAHLDELKANLPSLEVSDKAVPPEEGEMTWVYMEAKDVNVEDFFEGIVALASRAIKGKVDAKSQYRYRYPDKHNLWIAKVALDDSLLEKLLRGEKMADPNATVEVNYPLNTIFYGPPGTGKTYNTIHRAAEIVEGRMIEDYEEAKQVFNAHLKEEIEFITFHQNYSYEDFIQGLRPDIENSQQLTFERTDGVFKKLADKALKNWKASEKPQTKKLSFEQVFNNFIQPLVEGEVEEIEVEMKRVSYFITAVTDKSIEFRKSSGDSVHTLSINTLRRMYEAEDVMEIQGLSSYYSPLLKELLDRGRSPGETEVTKRRNYVMIIDEINRANISRVFGELITLIEPDKRYGREHHIPAKLPSGESFSVPENLYIIGTMNTADKSIALLDIALRRRFDFEAMYPKYEINGAKVYDSDMLEKINEKIVKLKGHDFQIGHSYFMNNSVSLKDRMNRKVIPLLLEYFMNDEKEVRGILEHAGLDVEEKTWPLRINGKK